MPDYRLDRIGDQYELTFEGSWPEAMMWEIPALAVLMELRSRAVLHEMGKFELQVLYARAMTRLWEKIERLRKLPDLRISDFGTRRRHSFLWQDWAVQAMIEGLGDRFLGTSNCLIAMRRDLEAIGTNAHELPMVYAALADDDDAALREAPYGVLENWHDDYDGNLRIILPDTYGTKGFLERAPDWLASWTGIRIDFGEPEEGAETAIAWWESRGQDPKEKLVIFSDGLDVDRIESLYARFHGRVKLSFGWGTLLTNDFRGLAPGRRARAVQPRLQGGLGQRPPDGEALRQPGQGPRPRRPGRALQARLRRRRADGRARPGLTARRTETREDP